MGIDWPAFFMAVRGSQVRSSSEDHIASQNARQKRYGGCGEVSDGGVVVLGCGGRFSRDSQLGGLGFFTANPDGTLGQEWSLKWVYEEFSSAETFGQSLGKLTNETGSDSRTTLRPR